MPPVAMVAGQAGDPASTVALRLAEDGFDVAVLGPDEAACARTAGQIEALGRGAVAVPVDTAAADSVLTAFARVQDTLGTPAVLLNHVGGALDSPVSDMSGSDWDERVAGHLRSAFVLSRAALDPMVKMGWGRIVTVLDVAGVDGLGPAENWTVRAGLEGFTRTLALELEPFAITTNLIVVWLGIADRFPGGLEPPGKAAGPLGRGRTRLPGLSHTVSFLAGASAGTVSGQVIHVASQTG